MEGKKKPEERRGMAGKIVGLGKQKSNHSMSVQS